MGTLMEDTVRRMRDAPDFPATCGIPVPHAASGIFSTPAAVTKFTYSAPVLTRRAPRSDTLLHTYSTTLTATAHVSVPPHELSRRCRHISTQCFYRTNSERSHTAVRSISADPDPTVTLYYRPNSYSVLTHIYIQVKLIILDFFDVRTLLFCTCVAQS